MKNGLQIISLLKSPSLWGACLSGRQGFMHSIQWRRGHHE